MAVAAVQNRSQVGSGSARAVAAPVREAAPKAVDGFERVKSVTVPALRRGATGAAVRAMQLKLVARGYLPRADFSQGAGVFGPRTETAVKRLQVEHGLPVTGVFEARSAAALNADRPGAKNEPSEAQTDVFEKPRSVLNAISQQTVTDDDEDFTRPIETP